MGDLSEEMPALGEERPPLIGLTTSDVRRAETISPTREGEPPFAELALGLVYVRAVEQAGGLPLVVPPVDLALISPLLDEIDGLCLSGGPDLDPVAYGQRPDPHLGPTIADLDRFELAVASAADRRGIPIFAICRGAQALNVVRGGTLIQHLPDRGRRGDGAFAEQIPHRQSIPGGETSHDVSIESRTRLAATIGKLEHDVNSFHHQAVDRLGRDLLVSARAPDGTIEAIEDPDRDFVVGVQWHAELLVARSEERALFAAFVEACRASRDRLRGAGRGRGQEALR